MKLCIIHDYIILSISDLLKKSTYTLMLIYIVPNLLSSTLIINHYILNVKDLRILAEICQY